MPSSPVLERRGPRGSIRRFATDRATSDPILVNVGGEGRGGTEGVGVMRQAAQPCVTHLTNP